jgi:hypothetical protein
MNPLRLRILLLFVVTIGFSGTCFAIEMSEISSTIENCRSNSPRCLCPTRQVDYIPCSIELGSQNHCGSYPRNSNPNADTSSWNACMERCKGDNRKITEYNNLVGSCSAHEGARQPSPPTTRPINPSATSNGELKRAKEEAKKKAQGSDTANERAKAELPSLKRNYEEEQRREADRERADKARELERLQRDVEANRARIRRQMCSCVPCDPNVFHSDEEGGPCTSDGHGNSCTRASARIIGQNPACKD